MKTVLPHTTPLMVGAMRLLPAGAMLVAWAAANGCKHPSTAIAWAWVAAFALVDAAAFQGFLAEGLTKTSAGLGSVIIDSQPLSVAVLAALLFGEQLSAVGVAGLGLGVAGLLLLEVPGESLQEGLASLFSGGFRPSLPPLAGSGSLMSSGEFWMLLAAQAMAVGTVMVRYVTKHVDPVMATGYHMIMGGAVLGVAAGLQGAPEVTSLGDMAGSLAAQVANLTPHDLAAMSYVSILGGAVSYGVFFWQASRGSLTALSSLTFLTPVFASLAGYEFLGETLTPMQLLGGAVTLASVFMINHQPQQQGKVPQPATPEQKAVLAQRKTVRKQLAAAKQAVAAQQAR
ncbi:hypothetical protein HYH03_001603 [Edaphochlamys debaryana]|uniref:EamA domain-containing protein n=1 Tax=Edaphochlamys debaryana TaxID=47281 RepID=A0A835YFM4_9CHLO|nr:hypothetical protein HYH03_001603 [Edaphochlamys debaryana]|eukprot:KAG2500842.1 hypothetical protein HYH03_001603 [Edaphochlamys debaryana]